MLQKAKGNLVTYHKKTKQQQQQQQTGKGLGGGGGVGNNVIQWFNTLLQTILAGVEDTTEGKGLAKDRDGKVEKATQDERMALGACSWLDFER